MPKKNHSFQEEKYSHRHAALAQEMLKSDLGALAINPGASLTYLTGLHFHLSERPVIFLFMPNSQPVFILPELEEGKTDSLPFEAQVYTYSEEPTNWSGVFRQAILEAEIGFGEIGIESRRMRILEFRFLEDSAPETQFTDAGALLSNLRMYKDQGEVLAIHKAVNIAQKALEDTLSLIRVGITEREIAAELTIQLLRNGSESEFPFSPIVQSGPNSANPHAVPSDRKLERGDLLVIDWGARYEGYISDITRTFAIGGVDDQLAHIAQVVLDANIAAQRATRPGISATDVDQAAREVIKASGYGDFFIHRTGHGIGLEGHEAPYIRAGNEMVLKPDMTFTIEPGIYLPGKGGVRIEDDVLVTECGLERLTDLPRKLEIIAA
ncbi:M24 family metallopeptidase [Chloroflexota bacterium]